MQNENQSFMDKRTILAIAISGFIFLGWQSYMEKKYPQSFGKPQVENSEKKVSQEVAETIEVKEKKVSKSVPVEKKIEAKEEVFFPYEDENISFEISSRGMGIRNIVLKKYTDREKNLVSLNGEKDVYLLENNIVNQDHDLFFDIVEKEEGVFFGIAKVSDGEIQKTMRVNKDDYSIGVEIKLKNFDTYKGVSTHISRKLDKFEEQSFFNFSLEQTGFYVSHGTTDERVYIIDGEDLEQGFSQAGIVALGSQYFATAVSDHSSILPKATVQYNSNSRIARGRLDYLFQGTESGDKKLEFTFFAGPKSIPVLEKADEGLASLVDYGFFSVIANPLSKLMKWFYSLFGNYGIAIILLTVIVRLIVMPFAIMSFKSMKSMQKIQPLIKGLREKHKQDPQTLNKEMMVLMREHKVNPLGGCLPMLLQIPVFFALYQVLGQSIELYQAPFFGWIQDLSLKDPYYVLPVLMGITMFIQQKITPTTMDPAQAKVMLFMPVLFSLMMISLPSGLTLYIFISTLFGIIQQFYFLNEKSSQVRTQEAKA